MKTRRTWVLLGCMGAAVAGARDARAAGQLTFSWQDVVPEATLVEAPADGPPAAPAALAAWLQQGLPLAGAREVAAFADATGSLIATPRVDGGAGFQHIYVQELAYGIRKNQVVLVRLRGLMDDGRELDIDHTYEDGVEVLERPGDFIGRDILWGCGDHEQELRVESVGYRIEANGEFRLDHLSGVLPDGERIDYQRPPGPLALRACEVENVNECVSDPDEPCDWGVCQGIIDCGCVGAGACVIRVKIKCKNVECYDPNVCKYNRDSGLCDCVGGDKHCQNHQPDPQRGSVACSPDGGRTVAENGHARFYVFEQPTEIINVDYAVEACRDATGRGNPCNVYVNLWHAPNFPQFPGAQLIDSQIDLVPDGAVFQRRTVQMNGQVLPPGPTVVEVYNHNAQDFFGFWPGSNGGGEEGPSFIRAQACGLPDWTPLPQIGRPNVHYIQCVTRPQQGPPPPEGIPCEDLRKFSAKCKRGKLIASAVMTDTRHAGENVRFAVDDIIRDVTIRGKKASYVRPGTTGVVNVELLSPFNCARAREVLCGGESDKECLFTTTADPKLSENCTECTPLAVGSQLCRSNCPPDENCLYVRTLRTTCKTKSNPNLPAYCTVSVDSNGCACLEP